MKHSRGVALIVALVILAPLTLIAVVLMQSGGMDLRASGAAAALQQVEHRVEGIIGGAMQQAGLATQIAQMPSVSTATSTVSGSMGNATMQYRSETVCKRRFDATSKNVIPACRYVELEASQAYGKQRRPMTWTVGVEQPLLKTAE
ncbi:type IVa pilus pseudopilin TppD [Aeromonas veronii]|uniref:type IVa pilus pseudopilin TppD n=1 Tax=Aeromonas veronii TaxID=654 RepID=UPI00222E8195|nr:type IVa pilus pseudopilin TppD [Aeromonas veronii]EKP0299852.1 type IVa pilus pseudopilin TppD [Aeromonas veronii]UZE60257.1 type IVa pilus pseudopilin TppD [Aeromonas veronii]